MWNKSDVCKRIKGTQQWKRKSPAIHNFQRKSKCVLFLSYIDTLCFPLYVYNIYVSVYIGKTL